MKLGGDLFHLYVDEMQPWLDPKAPFVDHCYNIKNKRTSKRLEIKEILKKVNMIVAFIFGYTYFIHNGT